MSTDPTMRASDADRERVAHVLRDAHAEGRLTLPEFEERLEATYAARTLAALAPLTRDLPAPSAAAAPTGRGAGRWAEHRSAWARWATVVGVCTAIWGASAAGSGEIENFWPIWVAAPWGALLVARTLFDSGEEPERPGRRDGEVDHR